MAESRNTSPADPAAHTNQGNTSPSPESTITAEPLSLRKKRTDSNKSETATTATGRLRSASLRILDANVPGGMWSATGTVVAQAPTPGDIRRGGVGEGEKHHPSITKAYDNNGSQLPSNAVAEEEAVQDRPKNRHTSGSDDIIAPAIYDEDGLPSNLFGRPELENQSYVRGQRSSVLSRRIPKLAVRKRDSLEGPESSSAEVFQDALESLPATTKQPVTSNVSSAHPLLEIDQDSDLDELDPRPKRKSKNIDAMLGRSPLSQADGVVGTPGSDTIPLARAGPDEKGVYPNGYSFPKPKPWTTATRIGFIAFLRFTFTPLGFLIVLYGLNVVAWGGMLFLLLCNASPAMCQLGNGTYDCNDIDSPRRVWVEIDSQILNALFCVTGFGLIPWRFRDLYFWAKWRLFKQPESLRRLAGYHNGWFRLAHSDTLPIKDYRDSQNESDTNNPALPLPLSKTPTPPLTGERAAPTSAWKLDFVIWAFVWNTFLQAVLSGFMWGLNRYDRPSWSTGLFVALACVVAACGGLVQFIEGKRIKKVEGVPLEVHQEYQHVEAGVMGREKADLDGKATV